VLILVSGGKMSKNIIFTKIANIADEYKPKPAYTCIPDWYKKTQSYVNSKERDVEFSSATNQSIKKCMPVFDILTAGYIIPTYCDLYIKKNSFGQIVYLPSGNPSAINFHSIIQAPYHPNMNQYPYPKWENPWSIKTPKGYSSLFIPPAHGGNKYFTVLEGFVDTDTYSAPVNFPFVLKDIDFEGLIPAGTPMVQVIPIKRDSWNMNFGNEKDVKLSNDNAYRLSSEFFDRYKKMFWNKKEYK
jgi:hypothetical protein